MGYDLRSQEFDVYIRVEIIGERNVRTLTDDTLGAWREIITMCHTAQIPRVLVLLKLTGNIPLVIEKTFLFAEQILKMIREEYPVLRVAVIDTNTESRRNNEFAVTVGVNRGSLVEMFENEDEALVWLSSRG